LTETGAAAPRKSIWSRAKEMAQQAPPERNRYVDFLRALSILAVVVGHWLVAAPYMKDGAVGGGHLLGGIGLDVQPGSTSWWLARPVWFILYIAALFPLIALFARYERASKDSGEVPHWRLIVGLLLICAGLGATAAISIASPLGVTGVRLWLVALPFVGAAIAQFGPIHRLAQSRA